MNRFIPALVAASLAIAPVVALAGPAEQAFLSKLPGVWKGTGTLTGGETGTVNCTLTMRGRSDGVNFSAKCDIDELGPQNFSGVISYNDDKGRYEATSNSGEVTVGEKSGSAVVFSGEIKGVAEGKTVMKITTSRIIVDTTARRPGGKADIKSHIELKR